MKKTILILVGLITLNIQSQAQTISDADGNVYNTVTIGTQTWLKENLKVTQLNDGTAISNETDSASWKLLTTPAFCNFNNTSDQDTINTYGRLYNWFTVNTKMLCPIGWHVPTDYEWDTLRNLLGGTAVAGGKLKEVGTLHWKAPNKNATDEYGFTALPANSRNSDGIFYPLGEYAYWWCSNELDANRAYYIGISNSTGSCFKSFYLKQPGFSIRCLKDSLLSNVNYNDNKTQQYIFPNPSTDRINVTCETNSGTIKIYSLLGEIVSQYNLDYGKTSIDISNLQTGIYIIKIENEQEIIQQKLIKK